MVKCISCGKFLPTKNTKPGVSSTVSCRCCVERTPILTKEVSTRACPPSSNTSSPLNKVEDAADSMKTVQLDVVEELRLFRGEIREMREELRRDLKDLRREVGELRHSIMACETRMEGLENRLQVLENQQTKVEDLEASIALLKVELNERDQELLSSDLEITNLPEEKSESAAHVVELVARKLGVQLDRRDVVFAERVGPLAPRTGTQRGSTAEESSVGGSPRRLVVRLARRQLRDELLQSARVRRGVTSADMGHTGQARRFYLNERLNDNLVSAKGTARLQLW